MQGMQQELQAVVRATPARDCNVAGCQRKAKSRGMCASHVAKARRRGELPAAPMCAMPECARPVECRGLCAGHYQNVRDLEAKSPCAHGGCERGARTRGFCRKHYNAAVRTATLSAMKFVKCSVVSCTELTRGPLCRRHHQRKKMYGLTVDELMLLDIGTTCDLCGARAQHVDHDHASGRTRGFLCGACNMGLGQFKDSPSLLRKAAAYLVRNGKAPVSEDRTKNV